MALPLGAIQVAVVSFIAYTLATVALGLRFWSRVILKLPLRSSDYMIILAMANASGAVAVFLAAGFGAGLGVHEKELLATDPAKFRLHLKLFVPAQLLWAAANTCNKISILFLYTDLFPGKKFARICHVIIGISTAYFLSVFLETFLLCTPAAYNWDKSIPGGVCHDQNLAYLLAGTTNLVIDAIVVALPMPKLFGLQMNMAKRISIAGMFSLGGFICIVSLLRVLWLNGWDLNDLTYTVTPGAIYSVLEPTLGIVNACLPTMKPAIKRMFPPRSFDQPSNRAGILGSANSNWKTSYMPGSAAHTFQPLNDNLPLTSIRGGCSQDSMTIADNQIAVTTEWVVKG
ncbi:hypothetical protein F4801DRAFT_556531 [Xylaria longipes]|nr:hypothetical protein F4801DRAFT_556531 [Xylaria longipes]RYC59916.1 Nucleoside-triphosphate phosphatase [Xylaria longipes]